jgi:hypothetical protein
VQARMREDIGGTAELGPTAAYLVGLGPGSGPFPQWEAALPVSPGEITRLWEAGCDISRALWDEQALLFLLDIDYQNIDSPAEPFLRPAEVFVKIEPVYRAVRRVLARYDIHTSVVTTGRGYHFVGRVPLDAPVVSQLAALAPDTPPWHATLDARRPAGVTAAMSALQARAWTGLGQVLEYIAHEVIREAQPESRIPVVVNGTVVGSGAVGRECTSVDLSYFGDPLDVRHLRVLFSAYQWHRLRPDIFGWHASADVPPLATLPRGNAGLLHMLDRGQSLWTGLQMAQTPVETPVVDAGLARLAEAYRTSALAAFHGRFHTACRDQADRIEAPAGGLPPCMAQPLLYPNDLLLKPAQIQHVVRGLMARGVEPATIAGIVRTKYEEDHGWGRRWQWMHPRTRAEFDVRVFAGLIVTGHDPLVDFNCVSAQEKDLCPGLPCRLDLRDDRERLRWGLEHR